jgi:hypothetical protein
MALAQYSQLFWFPSGALATDVPARVFEHSTNTLATLYADAGGTMPLANPLNTSAAGRLEFYVEEGPYWVHIDSEAFEISVGAAAQTATIGDVEDAVAAHVASVDPHGDRAYADSKLAKSANLSDLASAASARGNLGMVDMMPADTGLISWSYPPWAASSAGPGASGTIYYMRVKLPSAATVTGVRLYQTSAGSALTSGQCLVGLYDSAGNRVAVSADQSTAWASGSQVNKDAAFTSQYSAAAGYYWVALLFVGTTGPSWSKGPPSGLMNAGWSSAPFPALVSGSGQTALPASVTLSSLSVTVSAFWASVY